MGKFKKYNREDYEKKGERSFGRKDRFGGRREERSFSGKREHGFRRDFDRDEPEKEMFDVICDKCGKECKVPFKPTRGKPVYCSECFANKDSGSSSSGELDEINRKLDKIMRALKIN
jgi:CxxC-x17-CxxC domain-containing protein